MPPGACERSRAVNGRGRVAAPAITAVAGARETATAGTTRTGRRSSPLRGSRMRRGAITVGVKLPKPGCLRYSIKLAFQQARRRVLLQHYQWLCKRHLLTMTSNASKSLVTLLVTNFIVISDF